MKNKFITRITSVILSIMILISLASTAIPSASAATTQAAKTSAAPTGVTSFLTDTALSVLKAAIVYGLDTAADSAEDETLTSALEFTASLIEGSEKALAKDILEQTEYISAQIDALYTFTSGSFDQMDNKLNKLITYNTSSDYYKDREALRDFKEDTYEPMLNTYRSFLDAFTAYSENPTQDNKETLTEKYEDVLAYAGDTEISKKFSTDLTDFLQLISPYDPNYDTSQNCDDWGTKGNYKTYIDHAYDYACSISNFENNVYDMMKANLDEAGSVAYMYLQSYKYFIQVESLAINSDATISSTEAKNKINKMWKNFDLASKKLMRGLDQMCSLYIDEMNSYMRTYDTLAEIKLKNYKSSENIITAYDKYGDDVRFGLVIGSKIHSDSKKNLTSKTITEKQYFYQFRLVNEDSNNMYAIRTSSGNSSADHSKKANKQLTYADLVNYNFMFNAETCLSLDFLNLTKGTASPSGLNMINSQSQLNKLTDTGLTSNISSDNLIKNIRKELSMAHSTVYIPDTNNVSYSNNSSELEKGLFMLLDSKVEWNCDCNKWISDDADMTWLNVSMPINPQNSNSVYLDCEDEIYDYTNDRLKNKEAYVMYTGSPKIAAKVNAIETSGNGDAFVEIGGKNTISKNSSATVNSGNVMTLKVKPNDGSIVESVVIKNKYGEQLDVLFSAEKDSNGNTIFSAQELSHTKPIDENGYMEFTFPVPCQDVTFDVQFAKEDSTLKEHKVTLSDETNESVMQFTSYDFISTKEFATDKTVSVSVIPNDGKICTGIIVTDKNGTPIDILITDKTNDRVKLKPTEKIFEFRMTSHDIIVKPVIENGYKVNINADSNTIFRYHNINCLDIMGNHITTWEQGTTNTFCGGEKITIEVTAKQGYFVSDIDVYTDSKKIPLVTTKDNKITFEMPQENVNIRITTTPDSSQNKTVKLVNNNEAITDVDFVTESLHKLNVSETQFRTNDTISFITTGEIPQQINIIDTNGNYLDVKVELITTNNEVKNNECLFTFTMPDVNDIRIIIE